MPSSPSRTPISIDQLRADLTGRVIAPGDPDYDEARAVFVGGIDRHPALIVRPADADDVAHVVTLARETGTELAVRSGGHSNGGLGVSEGGIVIDLRDMRAIEIDVAGRTAWAETGLTARRVLGRRGRAWPGDRASATPDPSGSAGSPWAAGSAISCASTGSRSTTCWRPTWSPPTGSVRRVDRRATPRPVLGDPGRRRQLRRRHPLPVPAPRREPRSSAGC